METSTANEVANITVKVLTGEELAQIPQPDSLPHVPNSLWVVAFDRKGTMIGRTGLVSLNHVEGTWVSPDYRHGTLGWRLIRTLEGEGKKLGLSSVLAYSPDAMPEISKYLERMGYKELPIRTWAKEI
jgi:N-acetylglutamate synthase-like GNAT family acetyltransferase